MKWAMMKHNESQFKHTFNTRMITLPSNKTLYRENNQNMRETRLQVWKRYSDEFRSFSTFHNMGIHQNQLYSSETMELCRHIPRQLSLIRFQTVVSSGLNHSQKLVQRYYNHALYLRAFNLHQYMLSYNIHTKCTMWNNNFLSHLPFTTEQELVKFQ